MINHFSRGMHRAFVVLPTCTYVHHARTYIWEVQQMYPRDGDTIQTKWKVRIKTAGAAAMLMQDTQDDLGHLEQKTASSFALGRIKSRCPQLT